MVNAVKCPVCNGSGQLQNHTYGTIAVFSSRTCHGCNGKGWVEVGGTDGFKFYPPIW